MLATSSSRDKQLLVLLHFPFRCRHSPNTQCNDIVACTQLPPVGCLPRSGRQGPNDVSSAIGPIGESRSLDSEIRTLELYVLGLAPAAHGGNRTGRVFTGDRSGDWLYEALHHGSGSPTRRHPYMRSDGLTLTDCYIGATVRCAPPANKPTPDEFTACRPFVLRELRLLKRMRVVVTLGKIAFDHYLKASRELGLAPPSPLPLFGHEVVYDLPWGVTLVGSYHPSQQNTFTGKLTRPMFHRVFLKAQQKLAAAPLSD
jgi:uracil-DNA glycosylase family 4